MATPCRAPVRGQHLHMPTAPSVLVHATVLGLVSGGRSSAGLTALLLTRRRPGRAARAAGATTWLDDRRVSLLASSAVVGELVGDKLPNTPSRLSPPALGGRLVAGALCGAVLADRRDAARLLPALLGAGGALAGSWAGARYRAAAPGVPAALAEDAVVLGAAYLATRP